MVAELTALDHCFVCIPLTCRARVSTRSRTSSQPSGVIFREEGHGGPPMTAASANIHARLPSPFTPTHMHDQISGEVLLSFSATVSIFGPSSSLVRSRSRSLMA